MSPLPTMPLLVDSFIADTAHMSVEEVGAHIRLLMFAWRSPGCCLPADDARLARMLGTTSKRWAAIKPAVMALWVNSGGNYTNNRLTHEHQFVTGKVERKRAAGRLGGRPKSLELQEADKASGSAIEKHHQSKPKAPTPTPKESPLSPSGEEPDGFLEFRSTYPKRNVAFPTTLARKRWREAIRRGAAAADIIAGARAYAAEQQRIGKVGTEFVKTADSWLNQLRWQDFLAPPESTAEPANVSDDVWRDRVQRWRNTSGQWPWRGSKPPNDPDTGVPRRVLVELGVVPGLSSATTAMTGTG